MTLDAIIKASSIVTAIGVIGAGALFAEGRYFKIVEAQKIQTTIQKGQLNDLKREAYQFEQQKKKRPLTDLEEARLKEVLEAIEELKLELKK